MKYILLLSCLLLAACSNQEEQGKVQGTQNAPLFRAVTNLIEAKQITEDVPSLILTGVVDFATIPGRITAPQNMQSIQAVKKCINAAGDLTIEGMLKLSETSPNPTQHTLVARNLKLKHSFIVTRGHQLIIICETLEMDNKSLITSFVGNYILPQTPVTSTIHGTDGLNGMGEGTVYVYIMKNLATPLNVQLPGQYGGHGGNGLNGTAGTPGRRGRGTRNGSFGTCMRGPGKGKDGGNGNPGGNAGNGGNGGAGGSLWVSFVNIPVPSPLPVNFEGVGGFAGHAGEIGLGGAGGQGGLGGVS